MSSTAKHIREQLHAIMEEQGISQGELARRMGTHQPHISRLLNGPHVPTIDQLERAAKALGCDLSVSFEPAEKISA